MTPDEFKQRSEALISEWSSDFVPLYLAVTELRRLMYKRIFEKSGGNLNTAGQQIPLPARKGGDYQTDEIVGADIVRQRGGEVVTIDYIDGFSTTHMIQKIKKLP